MRSPCQGQIDAYGIFFAVRISPSLPKRPQVSRRGLYHMGLAGVRVFKATSLSRARPQPWACQRSTPGHREMTDLERAVTVPEVTYRAHSQDRRVIRVAHPLRR